MALQPGPGGASSNRLRAAAPSDGTKPKSTAAKTQPAAAPSIDWNAYAKQAFAPVDYAGLARIASGRAASETNSLVSGYQGLQTSALEQASQLAAQQNQFGLGASKYLQSLDLPGLTEQGYANAAAAQRAAAAGYSGGLQQTVTDAADAVQRNLSAIGSPQTAPNQGQAAGNALYGLGGQLPAESLAATGLAVAGGLRTLPGQAIGYGQTLAAERLGAGQTEAAKYGVNIAEARAKQGALAVDYLDKLAAAAQDAGQDRIANYYKALSIKQKDESAAALANYREGQLKISSFKANAAVDYQNARLTNDTARITETAAHHQALEKLSAASAANLEAYRNNQIDLGTFNANTSRINSQTSRLNAQTSRLNALKPPAPSNTAGTAPPIFDAARSNALGVRTDQYGHQLLYGKKKQPVLMPGWKWGANGMPEKKSSSKKGGITGLQSSKFKGIAQTIAQDFHNGYTFTDKATNEVKTVPPRTKAQAVAEMLRKGVPQSIIDDTINQWWVVNVGALPGHHD